MHAADADLLFTPSGVRLSRRVARPGPLNWLFLPGGPGIGSESLVELVEALDVPGSVWLVDLPGDGSNRNAPGASADPYDLWPQVVVEAAKALPNVVFAGHSTGGMYLLATPELEAHLVGLALLDTAPDCHWHQRFVEMTRANPIPEVDAATAAYEADRRDVNIAAIAVASAPWNFTPQGLRAGRDLLGRMPYNSAAVDWSDASFDHSYEAAWWPGALPTLILAGDGDRIVWQGAGISRVTVALTFSGGPSKAPAISRGSRTLRPCVRRFQTWPCRHCRVSQAADGRNPSAVGPTSTLSGTKGGTLIQRGCFAK